MKRILSRVLVGALVVSCLNVQVYAMDKRDGIVYKNGERIELSQEDLQELEDSYQELEEIRRDKQENREKYVTHRTRDELDEEASTYATFDYLSEIETNDTRSTADQVRELTIMEATIDNEDDIDWFKAKFDDYGLVEVNLLRIPNGCDYDLSIYNESEDFVTGSANVDNESEYIYLYVVPDEWYYFRVTSADSYDDTEQYRLKIHELMTNYRANFYGSDQGDINTEPDVEAGERYFGTEGDFSVDGMGYDVLAEYEPTRSKIYDSEGASVLAFSGHGFQDRVKMKVVGKEDDIYKCGIITGEDRKEKSYSYAGIDEMYLDACRLAVLSACLTAADTEDGSDNIAESMVKDAKVKSSIGWRVYVNSTDLSKWLNEFYRNLANGYTVGDSQEYVNTVFDGAWDPSVYTSAVYGDANTTVTLPITDTKAQNQSIDDIYNYFDEDLHINKATKDFHEVEDYLAKKVPGFNLEDFVLDEYQLMDRNGMYYLNYNYVVSGYETPYYVMVYCENDIPVKYYVKLPSDEQKQAMKPVQVLNMDDKIAEAKEKAVENIFENKYLDNLTVESQEVTSKMDENGNTYLYVSTTYTFTDDDDVITGVDKYQYVLQCNL